MDKFKIQVKNRTLSEQWLRSSIIKWCHKSTLGNYWQFLREYFSFPVILHNAFHMQYLEHMQYAKHSTNCIQTEIISPLSTAMAGVAEWWPDGLSTAQAARLKSREKILAGASPGSYEKHHVVLNVHRVKTGPLILRYYPPRCKLSRKASFMPWSFSPSLTYIISVVTSYIGRIINLQLSLACAQLTFSFDDVNF